VLQQGARWGRRLVKPQRRPARTSPDALRTAWGMGQPGGASPFATFAERRRPVESPVWPWHRAASGGCLRGPPGRAGSGFTAGRTQSGAPSRTIRSQPLCPPPVSPVAPLLPPPIQQLKGTRPCSVSVPSCRQPSWQQGLGRGEHPHGPAARAAVARLGSARLGLLAGGSTPWACPEGVSTAHTPSSFLSW